jgi:hypothetical protein
MESPPENGVIPDDQFRALHKTFLFFRKQVAEQKKTSRNTA